MAATPATDGSTWSSTTSTPTTRAPKPPAPTCSGNPTATAMATAGTAPATSKETSGASAPAQSHSLGKHRHNRGPSYEPSTLENATPMRSLASDRGVEGQPAGDAFRRWGPFKAWAGRRPLRSAQNQGDLRPAARPGREAVMRAESAIGNRQVGVPISRCVISPYIHGRAHRRRSERLRNVRRLSAKASRIGRSGAPRPARPSVNEWGYRGTRTTPGALRSLTL